VPLDVLEHEGAAAAPRLIPLERLLPAIPPVVLTEDGVRRALHGNTLPPSAHESELPQTARVRLLDGAGHLVGIAELEPGGLLHPVIVLM
jgi:tRNA U55 pseudouridine synthase TruB